MYHFRFVNFFMDSDIFDKNGRTVNYREINVLSDREDNARLKAYRPKIDGDQTCMLGEQWELIGVFALGKDWQ